ncbi:MAG: PglZ domain-containing protein [Flavobacteriales bacterium]|nr:PglZ domain-containing protein [Flavobacteriales bacterium]MCX7768953.1 PglZ domain-containing protein [Flavobacteriales bacterium]MDW8410783.1 PglZ domain-containing protein [Flavobacteriales bacterium]
MSDKVRILWADDEADLLKPHVIFLQNKGYEVEMVTSGDEAIHKVKSGNYDVVFLDEHMPGLSGLEALENIKTVRPHLPVVMITKSEEENIMEDAIGSRIADYLIKPVNPHQILLSLKKILEAPRIISDKTTSAYRREFGQIGMTLSDKLSFREWCEVYRRLVYWEMELDGGEMEEILLLQKQDANRLWCRFVERHYRDWLTGRASEVPTMSHTAFRRFVAPLVDGQRPVFLFVVDNLRYDQWKVMEALLAPHFRTEEEQLYCSILPTATQYARNAFFAGLMPSEIQKRYPSYWVNEDEERGKNLFEEQLLQEQLRRLGKNFRTAYFKILNLAAGHKLVEQFANLSQNALNVVVYNFVDMLSHARTDMEVIRELASDESAYRSITRSWFEHSPLMEMIVKAGESGGVVLLTTDHGTIRVKEPTRVLGDRETSTNLRYKQGRNLKYDPRDVVECTDPAAFYLPRYDLTTKYIFIKENKFFAYPNNFNYYANFYRNTFQHGGVSLEEMLIPFVRLTFKK